MTRRNITDKGYAHVFTFCSKFGTETMENYHDLYLRYDASLLSDVFKSLNIYGLCPSHLRAPGLSLDAMLKMTKIGLENTPDRDMYMFFKKCKNGNPYISN